MEVASGGGVRKALPHLGETFYVLNADSLWIEGPGSNLSRLAEAWDPERMDVLLLLAATTSSVGWENRGDFAMDQDGRLRRPKVKEVTPFAYAGVGLWKKSLFAERPDVFSLNVIFDEAIAAGRLFGLHVRGAGNRTQSPHDLLGLLTQDVQVIAIEADAHVRFHAGHQFGHT